MCAPVAPLLSSFAFIAIKSIKSPCIVHSLCVLCDLCSVLASRSRVCGKSAIPHMVAELWLRSPLH